MKDKKRNTRKEYCLFCVVVYIHTCTCIIMLYNIVFISITFPLDAGKSTIGGHVM